MPAAIGELPITVATILAAIQKVAQENGFSADDEKVRLECIAVFSDGGPDKFDDSVDFTFVSSRLVVNGSVVQGLISKVAPNLAARFTQQFAAKAVPVLGGITGSVINYAFIDYYIDVAKVRFGLLRVAQKIGPEEALRQFKICLEEERKRRARVHLV